MSGSLYLGAMHFDGDPGELLPLPISAARSGRER